MNDERGWSSVPNWVIRSDKLHGSEKLLYIALLNRANAKGECWPSLATLAKEVGVSNRTVMRLIDSLCDKRLIEKVRRTKQGVGKVSNLYRVLAFEHRPPSDNVSPASDKTGKTDGAICHHPSDNEHHEVLPREVLPIRSTTHLSAREIEQLFEQAYFSWPKKVERKKSLEKFRQACRKRDPHELVADIERFGRAYAETTERRFVPALNVWLNGERWTDDLPEPDEASQPMSKASQNAAEFRRLYGSEGSVPAIDPGVGS